MKLLGKKFMTCLLRSTLDFVFKFDLRRGYDIGATCTAMHSMALGLKHGDHRER